MGGRDDQTSVTDATCHPFRELISARMDGEIEPSSESNLDAHVAICTSCRLYQDDAFALRRSLRMRAVTSETSPEQSTGGVDLVGSLRAVTALRWALFVIGGTLVLLNFGPILSVDGTSAAHLNRHDGVFGMALGIGMLAVAAKPHRAMGLLPLTSAVAVLMGIVAAVDLVAGNANLLAESIHVVQFAGLICLWMISGGPTRFAKLIDTQSHRFPRLLRS